MSQHVFFSSVYSSRSGPALPTLLLVLFPFALFFVSSPLLLVILFVFFLIHPSLSPPVPPYSRLNLFLIFFVSSYTLSLLISSCLSSSLSLYFSFSSLCLYSSTLLSPPSYSSSFSFPFLSPPLIPHSPLPSPSLSY